VTHVSKIDHIPQAAAKKKPTTAEAKAVPASPKPEVKATPVAPVAEPAGAKKGKKLPPHLAALQKQQEELRKQQEEQARIDAEERARVEQEERRLE